MQRVANCVLVRDNQVLLLQKPRRNWWVAPGGKMEAGETVRDACIREYWEETGIQLLNPQIKGIFTFIIKDREKVVSEWMMFTFYATHSDGTETDECEEGILAWHDLDKIKKLPMAPGDYHILEYMIRGHGVIYGAFTYTPDFELIHMRLDPS